MSGHEVGVFLFYGAYVIFRFYYFFSWGWFLFIWWGLCGARVGVGGGKVFYIYLLEFLFTLVFIF